MSIQNGKINEEENSNHCTDNLSVPLTNGVHNYLRPDAGIIMFMNGVKVETATVKISQPSLAGNVLGEGNAERGR